MTTSEHLNKIKAKCEDCLNNGRDNGIDKWTGPAEAGWRGTIAAIDGLSDVNTCDQWCRGNMPEAADAILEDIIAAWPEELL